MPERRALGGLALGAMALAAGTARAQEPEGPVTIMVPYTPGTGMDILSRLVAPYLQQETGQPFVVENRPGASGNIGTLMAKIEPNHVPYRGSAPAIQDLIGKRVAAMVLPVHTALPLAAAGQIRMVAVGSPQRAAAAPQVPTIADGWISGRGSQSLVRPPRPRRAAARPGAAPEREAERLAAPAGDAGATAGPGHNRGGRLGRGFRHGDRPRPEALGRCDPAGPQPGRSGSGGTRRQGSEPSRRRRASRRNIAAEAEACSSASSPLP